MGKDKARSAGAFGQRLRELMRAKRHDGLTVRAIDLVLQERHRRRALILAGAAGFTGIALGLLIDDSHVELAVLAAVVAAMAFSTTR